MTTRFRDTEALFTALTANPDDWITWRVLADSLIDDGHDAVSAAIRWMIGEQKRPWPSSIPDPDLGEWRWNQSCWTVDSLPSDVFDRLAIGHPLKCDHWPDNYSEMWYPTLADAIHDLAYALTR